MYTVYHSDDEFVSKSASDNLIGLQSLVVVSIYSTGQGYNYIMQPQTQVTLKVNNV